MAEQQIHWPGQSGKKYTYWIYPIETTWAEKAGNYIFAKKLSNGNWTPIYIGETGDLRDRLPNHEKLPCATRNGATHIHTHTSSSGQEVRRAEEADLIAKSDPPCNKE